MSDITVGYQINPVLSRLRKHIDGGNHDYLARMDYFLRHTGSQEFLDSIGDVVSDWLYDLDEWIGQNKMSSFGFKQDLNNPLAEKLVKFNKFLRKEWRKFKEIQEELATYERKRPKVVFEEDGSVQLYTDRKDLRKFEDRNPITWRWDPETINLRQIDWLMERKRRIFKEQRLDEFMFNYEMKELAKLRKRELDKTAKFREAKRVLKK